MRHRVEDLGRLDVMLNKVLDDDIFSVYHGRNKDFPEFFKDLEDKTEFATKLWYALKSIEEELYSMLTIARGEDYLNEQPERYNYIRPQDY